MNYIDTSFVNKFITWIPLARSEKEYVFSFAVHVGSYCGESGYCMMLEHRFFRPILLSASIHVLFFRIADKHSHK